jgi:hypothetical protein
MVPTDPCSHLSVLIREVRLRLSLLYLNNGFEVQARCLRKGCCGIEKVAIELVKKKDKIYERN